MNKKWLRSLFRQRMLVCLLLILQFLFMIYLLSSSSAVSDIIAGVLKIISIIVSLYIFSRRDKSAYKLTWVFIILMFPLFGGLFYLLFNFQSTSRNASKRVEHIAKKAKPFFDLPGIAPENAIAQFPEIAPSVNYMQQFAGFPVYNGGETSFLTPGEKFFEKLISELEKAEKYIFLEYFIIQEGKCGTPFLKY